MQKGAADLQASRLPPQAKRVSGKCAPTFTTDLVGPIPASVQAPLAPPLVASATGIRTSWVFLATAIASHRGEVAEVACQYKKVNGTPQDAMVLYSFQCKNPIKQGEDAWACQV